MVAARTLVHGPWRVQPLTCYEVGRQLLGTRPPPAEPAAAAGPHASFVELLCASVCHGTNWDQLRQHMYALAGSHPASMDPARLASLTLDEFVAECGPAFSGGDVRGRHSIVVAVALAVSSGDIPLRGWEHDGCRAGGAGGIFDILGRVRAFGDDPQAKKARVFAQQMARTGLLHIEDVQQLRPAIEYHLIRLYLRTGRVVPVTSASRRTVENSTTHRVDSLNQLREAVEEAMRYTADAADKALWDLNDIEWQVGRSFCTRDSARCTGPAVPGKLCDAYITDGHQGCPLAPACPAQSTGTITWQEPRLASKYTYY